MLGGGWIEEMLHNGALSSDEIVADMAQAAAWNQLGIPPDIQPSKVNVAYNKVS